MEEVSESQIPNWVDLQTVTTNLDLAGKKHEEQMLSDQHNKQALILTTFDLTMIGRPAKFSRDADIDAFALKIQVEVPAGSTQDSSWILEAIGVSDATDV